MDVRFNSRDPEAARLRLLVERRVRFVFRRVTQYVPRAQVQLSDLNGPRGGLDKRCQVELQTEGRGPVVVTSVAHSWPAALNDALERALRFARRLWQRVAGLRRSRPRQIELER